MATTAEFLSVPHLHMQTDSWYGETYPCSIYILALAGSAQELLETRCSGVILDGVGETVTAGSEYKALICKEGFPCLEQSAQSYGISLKNPQEKVTVCPKGI